MSKDLYTKTSYDIAERITKNYSTSFSLATSLLKQEERRSIYAIYGFVRLADEIVDTFHHCNQELLLNNLGSELETALTSNISTNPILLAFTDTVKKYNIEKSHIDAFMKSMHNDLSKKSYKTEDEINNYIYGSADVVGLMCLKVFCKGNNAYYTSLEDAAQKLGSAFQKVNFLRDLKDDIEVLGRSYFPEIKGKSFDKTTKHTIETSIDQDFENAKQGIKKLPGRSKLAVAIAFYYYKGLLKKIKRSSPEKVLQQRIRISNTTKYLIIIKASILYALKAI